MIDIKLIRTNPELVKENIKKKFQDEKLPLVDEVIDLDNKFRESKNRGDFLRSQRNSISKQIGAFMAKGQKEEAEKAKAQVNEMAQELAQLEIDEANLQEEIQKIALEDSQVKAALGAQSVLKVIVIPKRLVNIVAK